MDSADRKRESKLTKFIRLTVYSYLDLETTVRTVLCLSKSERDNLKASEIAREGKHFILHIDKDNRPDCLLCRNEL